MHLIGNGIYFYEPTLPALIEHVAIRTPVEPSETLRRPMHH